ncbi:hypothetical protein COOONC_15239 [Cooperia oncophora]
MFTDNVGVASVTSNYRSGQLFTWGYYRVVYVAYDAANNTAVCSFSVVVSPADCKAPKADEQGQWNRSTYLPASGSYTFPSCGSTQDPVQNINGSLGDYGDCSTIRQDLRDWLLKDLWPYCSDQNCTGQLWIDSNCTSSGDSRLKRSIWEAFYNFHFYAKVNSTRLLLKDTINGTLQNQFPNASISISDSVECDDKFPRLSKANGSASCADCAAGQYYSGDTCVKCPKDTYRRKDDPLEKCMSCEEKCYFVFSCPEIKPLSSDELDKRLPKSLSWQGAKNATDCSVKCDAGKELAGSENCVSCAKGTYWPEKLKIKVRTSFFTGCVDCPLGLTTVATGSRDIRDCEVVNCPPGTHVNTNRSDPIDATRAVFYELCNKCKMGTYQDERNQTSCKPCTPTSDCPLVNECSPILPDTCLEGCNCERQDTGVYSCVCPVVVIPTPNFNSWVLWIVVPLVGVLILVTLGITAYICRQSIYMMMCCKKPDFKQFESTDYYRSPMGPPRVSRGSIDNGDYRNYPPRRLGSVRPSQALSTIAVAPRRISTEELDGSRFRDRHLPPPIITSKAELDLLEEQARRRAMATNAIPLSSRSLGSQVGHHRVLVRIPRAIHFGSADLPEDPSSSYSLHWSESTPNESNDVYGDDDDVSLSNSAPNRAPIRIAQQSAELF